MDGFTIDPDLYAVDLAEGGHETRDQGMCLMEWLAFLAHEQHSDHPECVSPVLGTMGRHLNDTLPGPLRQQLKTIGVSALGTAGDGFDEARSYMALDWLIRTYLPAWLDLSPPCRESAAVGAAARAAAGDAARAAAGDVLRPTVEELQLSAVDLFAAMVKGPFPDGGAS